MDYLVAVVTICILSTQPKPDSTCHDQEIYSKYPFNMYGCEGIMDQKMFRMREELRSKIKPSEMLSMKYECKPISFPELDHT